MAYLSKLKKIKEIGQVITGKTPPTKVKEYFGNKYPFITPTDITGGTRFVNNLARYLSDKGYEYQKNLAIPSNAICFTCIGSKIGKIAMTNRLSFTNQQINSIIVNNNIADYRYIFYLLKTEVERIKNYAGGAAKPIVSKSIFENISIPCPPLPIQRKVASILSAYDDLIELNEQRIKILEEMARLIYKEWFVKFRFPEHEKVKMIESEIGMIPEGWAVRSILDIEGVNLIKARIKRYNGVKEYFATANVEENNIIKNGEIVTYDERPSRAQMQPEENTIWFAKMRETFKVLCFTSTNKERAENSVLSTGFAGLKVDKDKFSFIFFTVCSERFHALKDQYCTGATQMSSTIEGLSLIKIVLPDKNLVKEYSELIQPMIDQIIRFQQQNQLLRQTRDMLLQKLISGKINISNIGIKSR